MIILFLCAVAVVNALVIEDVPIVSQLTTQINVTNHYATTLITCKIFNPNNQSSKVKFSMVLPKKSFISDFIMKINGTSYKAYVKEKSRAQDIYDSAVNAGQGAAQVKVSARNSHRFIVDVNLEAKESATFYLTYEELLERKLGQYEIVVNVHPGQIVEDLRFQININETQPFKSIGTPKWRRGSQITAKTIDTNASVFQTNQIAVINFNPDEEVQRYIGEQMETGKANGISGQFVITYDLVTEDNGGLIIQSKDYFTHYYVPKGFETLKKYLIFILDTSGSMIGNNLSQLKSALNNILPSLKHDDLFNIIHFNSLPFVWNLTAGEAHFPFSEEDLPPAYKANENNIQRTKQMIRSLNAEGGTNMLSVFQTAFNLLKKNLRNIHNHQPMFVFLTDGDVTVGEYNYTVIAQAIKNLNSYGVILHTLSFGPFVSQDFLENIALTNQGIYEHIYEDTDASLQLQNFFKKILDLVLKNVSINYGENVQNVTNNRFDTAFEGTELVVSGRKTKDLDDVTLTGTGLNGDFTLKPVVETVESPNMKRLWAYLRVKQLLDQRKIADNKAEVTQKALRLALKYSFVTELTSLVVVKPNAIETTVGLEDASNELPRPSISYSHGSGGYGYPVSYNTLSTSYTSQENVIVSLKTNMQWLENLLLNNGTIVTSTAVLHLDLSPLPSNRTAKCQIATNVIGKCLNLQECHSLHPRLNNLDDILKRACKLDKTFTGVCC